MRSFPDTLRESRHPLLPMRKTRGYLYSARVPPKLTVITPSFNQGKFIERTIRSVLDQGYPNLEYAIVDGGSTDETVEVIRRYEDRLAWWVSEQDDGQSHAINKGVERTSGEIVAYLNSDDYFLPGRVRQGRRGPGAKRVRLARRWGARHRGGRPAEATAGLATEAAELLRGPHARPSLVDARSLARASALMLLAARALRSLRADSGSTCTTPSTPSSCSGSRSATRCPSSCRTTSCPCARCTPSRRHTR